MSLSKRIFAAFCTVIVTSALAGGLSAASWTGAGAAGDWSDPANWSPAAPPGASDLAFFPGPAVLAITTGVPPTVGQIVVTNTMDLTIRLSGALNVPGLGAPPASISVTGTLTFSGGFPVSVGALVSVNVGSLIFSDDFVLGLGAIGPVVSVSLGDGTLLDVAGTLIAPSTQSITASTAASPATVNANDIDVAGVLTFQTSGNIPNILNVGGDITYVSNGAGLRVNMWIVTMDGDIDVNTRTGCIFTMSASPVTFTSASLFTGTTATFGASSPVFNNVTIDPGASLTLVDGLAMTTFDAMDIDGSFNAGDNDLSLNGDLDVDAAGIFQQNAASPGTVSLDGLSFIVYSIIGAFTIGGDVEATTAAWVVALGSSLTIGGDLWISGGSFGADQDGASATGRATITYSGDFRADTVSGFVLGEGTHNFAGNLDIGATVAQGDIVAAPGATNNEVVIINLTGSTMNIDFGGTGSMFAVASVVAATRVIQTGTMILVDDLELSGANGGAVWTAIAATISVGTTLSNQTITIRISDGSLALGSVVISQVSNTTAGDRILAIFRTTAGGTGIMLMSTLTVEGDTLNDVAGPESNAAECRFIDSTMGATTIIVSDGDTATVLGNGAQLLFEGCTVNPGNSLTVGGGGATAADAGARLEFRTSATNPSTVVMAAGSTLTANAWARVLLTDTSLGSSGAYLLQISATTDEFTAFQSTITAANPGELNVLSLGSTNLFLIRSNFSNYAASGVNIPAATTIRAFNECTFTGGQNNGAHITLNGIDAASVPDWDLNLFDDSVNTGATGLLVDIAGGTNAARFRVPSSFANGFGTGAASFTAAQAEAADNDGTTVATDVIWDDGSNELAVVLAGGQPLGAINTPASGDQTILLFNITAVGAAMTVSDLTVDLNLSGATLVIGDLNQVSLFNDINSDGLMTPIEVIQQVTGPATEIVTFAAISQSIGLGLTVDWGIALSFNASAGTGLTSPIVSPGGIIEAGSNIVSGLPVFNTVVVTGPPDHVVVVTEPGGASAGVTFTTQPVIEVRDSVDNVVVADSASTLTASIQVDPSIGATLSGTSVVTALNGVATYAGLSIDLGGNGFVLRFTASFGAPAEFDDSAPFNVSGGNVDPVLAAPAGTVDLVIGGSDPNFTASCNVTENLAISFTASDADGGDTLTFTVTRTGGSLTAAAAGFSEVFTASVYNDPSPGVSPQTLTLSGTALAAGTIELTVSVDDGNGGTDQYVVTVAISAAGNNAPVLAAPSATVIVTGGVDPNFTGTVQMGQNLAIDFTATDVDLDTLTTTVTVTGGTLTALQAGFVETFPYFTSGGSPHTLSLSGSAATVGNIVLLISVDDGNGGLDQYNLTLTITTAVAGGGGDDDDDSGCAGRSGSSAQLWLLLGLGAALLAYRRRRRVA